MRDLYEIIGVDKSASNTDIKKSYRKIAMKYHPDKNPDDKEAEINFKEAAEAYSILSDDQKRQQYDQFGHAGVGIGDNAGSALAFTVECLWMIFLVALVTYLEAMILLADF